MKKIFAKITMSILTIAMSVSMMASPLSASAEENSVKVYFKNTPNWENVYCYTWADIGGTGKGWPGDEMTPIGDGWYEFEYTGSKVLNCIFNDNGQPKATQTANHSPADLSIDKNAYWFTASSNVEDSGDGMSSGYTVTVSETAPDDFPTLSPESETQVPKTGNTSISNTVLIVSACCLFILAICMKKRIYAK